MYVKTMLIFLFYPGNKGLLSKLKRWNDFLLHILYNMYTKNLIKYYIARKRVTALVEFSLYVVLSFVFFIWTIENQIERK